MAKTLASFLADRPEHDLAEMLSGIKQKRQRLQEEDRDLEFEERLVEQALARKSRRTGTPGGGRVTREQVYEIVSASVPDRFRATDARGAMEARGLDMSAESLRQHLRRLASDGKFPRLGEWYLNPRAPEQPPAENGTGRTTQAFPNPHVEVEGRDREIRTDLVPRL
jgi:hypothetical protein